LGGVSVRVGLLQVRIDGEESVRDRIARVVALVDSVAHGSAHVETVTADGVDTAAPLDVIVLPELWTVGAFDANTMLANPEGVDGDVIASLRRIAGDTSTWIHAGSLPERTADGVRHNTSVLINADGQVAAVYRKVHLFGFDEGEAVLLESGQDLVVHATPLGSTGLATCYDLRFPELFRGLLDAGAGAFLLASGWPAQRIEHWRVLLRARAIENLAWMVACNEVGVHAGVELGGRSSVIDPWGEVVVEGPTDRECLVIAEVDPAQTTLARERFPVLRDRRM
jgi:predicted amidohydrolase